MTLIIKPEQKLHSSTVRKIHELANNGPREAALVEALRASPEYIGGLSLVAQLENQVVGHIMFTKASIKNGTINLDALALATVAVLPDFQNMGIGAQLVRHGLEKALQLGYELVLVLGNKWFYTRFDFEQALAYNILPPCNETDLNNAEFMIYCPNQALLSQVRGVAVYPQAFKF